MLPPPLKTCLSSFIISTIMCFSLPSCSKLNEPSKPIIKEYFAPDNVSVKQEVYNFLKAAGRIQTATKSTLNLSDKEPNEGAWLMEAAINYKCRALWKPR